MRQDARFWNEGYRAGVRGMGLAARRYPVGSTASWSWSSGYVEGYVEGNADRLKKRQLLLDENTEH